jgi:hypothetical protein
MVYDTPISLEKISTTEITENAEIFFLCGLYIFSNRMSRGRPPETIPQFFP